MYLLFVLGQNMTPIGNDARVCSVPYRYSRYRYGCRTELTEVSGTGIDVVPNLPKCLVPVLMSYRTYRSVRYRYEIMYRYRYRYRHTLKYICRQYRRYIPPASTDAHAIRYINWT